MLKNINRIGIIIREQIIRFFWPEICPFCGKASVVGICSACRKKLEHLKIDDPRCMKCGKPVRYFRQEYCYDCEHTHHYYDRGVALWIHKEPVSQSIYRFKFHNQRGFAKYYAEEVEVRLKKDIQRWNPDFIIPIPLYSGKMRKRGFNQAEVFAKELENFLGIPVYGEILTRTKHTKPQKTLGSKERKNNLQGAFVVSDAKMAALLSGKTVLLIDDIYTTGSTIDAAAQILKRAGAEKVYYLTISIGQGY